MKILQVCSTISTKAGGPSEAAKQLAARAPEYGAEVETVSLDAAGEYDIAGTHYALGPAVAGFAYSKLLFPWLQSHASSYDVVLVRGLWQYHGIATWRALRNSNTPYYVFAHGMLDPWFKRFYPLKHIKKQLFWLLVQHAVLRDARAVLFTTEEERRLARESFQPYRIQERVISYGSSQASSPLADCEAAFFAQCPLLQNKRYLLFFGRIHEKKGSDLLLNSFARVAKQFPDLHLVFAGPKESSFAAMLEQRTEAMHLESRVHFVGLITGEAKWGALSAADAFILPSHQENFGIAVAEALACATPVLLSNKVNIWREVQEERAGIIAEDSALGVDTLLANWMSLTEAERGQYRRNARLCYEQHFTIEAAVQSLLSTIAEV